MKLALKLLFLISSLLFKYVFSQDYCFFRIFFYFTVMIFTSCPSGRKDGIKCFEEIYEEQLETKKQ